MGPSMWCHNWRIIPSDNSWVQDGSHVGKCLGEGWVSQLLFRGGIPHLLHHFLGPIGCRNFCLLRVISIRGCGLLLPGTHWVQEFLLTQGVVIKRKGWMYSVGIYSVNWLLGRFFWNYPPYLYKVFAIGFGIQKLRNSIHCTWWPKSQWYWPGYFRHNFEIKGENHEKVTKCKKLKLSIFAI